MCGIIPEDLGKEKIHIECVGILLFDKGRFPRPPRAKQEKTLFLRFYKSTYCFHFKSIFGSNTSKYNRIKGDSRQGKAEIYPARLKERLVPVRKQSMYEKTGKG